jgi:hypothetical protein
MRNLTAIAMRVQFAGKGGVMRDRRARRGGTYNEARDLLDEYQELCDDAKKLAAELPDAEV